MFSQSTTTPLRPFDLFKLSADLNDHRLVIDSKDSDKFTYDASTKTVRLTAKAIVDTALLVTDDPAIWVAVADEVDMSPLHPRLMTHRLHPISTKVVSTACLQT